MGKRGGGKKRASDGAATTSYRLHNTLSLREEASGRKQTHNPKLISKLKHLQRLAEWSSKETSIPSLGAFFGHRYAEMGEALGIRPDRSLFSCQRCETILQPSSNCDVRMKKNRAKGQRRHNETNVSATQINVVYTCNFCSHRNLKQVSPNGHIKGIAHLNVKPSLNPKPGNSTFQKCDNSEKNNAGNSTVRKCDNSEKNNAGNSTVRICDNPEKNNATNSTVPICDNPEKHNAANSAVKKCDNPEKISANKAGIQEAIEVPLPSISNISTPHKDSTTPLSIESAKLLDSKRRKRKKTGPKGPTDEALEAEKASGTSKKKKKTWTSLKEIAASEEHERNQKLKSFSIPFLL